MGPRPARLYRLPYTFIKYVSATGKVNYKALKENEQELRTITEQFTATQPTSAWSRNQQLAFWINAYNAFTLQLIVDNYPLKSIAELDGGKTWDIKRIKIGNKTFSLNQIENEIIRPTFKDARIHFAVNCAAVSCPPLYNQAFVPEKLQEQLQQRTRKYVQSKSNIITEKEIKISKIFEWYKADFSDIAAFLNQYSTIKIMKGATIEFLKYNWSLNE